MDDKLWYQGRSGWTSIIINRSAKRNFGKCQFLVELFANNAMYSPARVWKWMESCRSGVGSEGFPGS